MASKVKYTFVSTECNDSNDDEPLIICDSKLINNLNNTPNQQNFKYELNSGVQYRVVGSTTTTTANSSSTQSLQQTRIKNTSIQSVKNNSNVVPKPISEMISVSSLQTNRPCVICPKTIISNTSTKRDHGTSRKVKRDDARRATHNEVERRRRDKINQWIDKLRILLPEEVSSTEKQPTSKTVNDSKSAILIRACDYIKNQKDELENLKLCLNDYDQIKKLNEENDFLRSENQMLLVENERLKEILSDDKKNIKIESPTSR